MLPREAGAAQCDERPGGVPHRRHARLQSPSAGAVLEREPAQPVEASAHHRVIEWHALEVERDEGVHPWGLDAAPASVCLLPCADPVDQTPARKGPTGLPWRTVIELEHVVEPPERAATGHTSQTLCGLGRHELGHIETQGTHRPA